MRYFYIIFASLLLSFLSPQLSLAAEGDLVWTQVNNFSSYNDSAFGVATDDSGVYVVGTDVIISSGLWDNRWRVQKRNKADGSVLWSQLYNYGNYYEAAWGVAVDSTGVYVIGNVNTHNIGRLEKRSLVDGSIIWAKSVSGDLFNDIAVDNSGIYLTGGKYDTPASKKVFVEKRDLNGNPVWTDVVNYSTSGQKYTNHIVINNSNIYVFSSNNSQYLRFEKRNLDGSLVWVRNELRYTGCGLVPCVYLDNLFYANGLAIDSTGLYVVGLNYMSTFNNKWRIEKRNFGNGDPLWSVNSDPYSNSGEERPYGVDVDSTGVYIVGDDYSLANQKWRLEKRNLSNGALFWNKTSNPSSGKDIVFGVTVDSSGIYMAGSDSIFGLNNEQWRIEKREIVPPLLSDLTAGSVSPLSATVGSATTFSSVISNVGTAGTSASFNNLFQFDSDTNHAVVDDTRTVIAGPLAVSGTENVSVSYTFPSSGTWYVSTCADSNTSILESNESNNCSASWTTVAVTAVPTGTITPADCIITSGTTCTASIAWSTSNVTSPNIKNNGVTFNTLPSSVGTLATLFYGLNTLELFDGTTLLDTAFAFGLASDQGAGGPSCGGSFTSQPTTGLCASGTVSPIVPAGSGWGWTCGTGVGQVACTAINIGSFCPNTICESGESMLTCPQDCGAKKVEQF